MGPERLDDILGCAPASGKSCLIVDDSRAVRRIVSQIFTDLGYSTMQAANGIQALECCRVQVPDLILLDWNMPVMDGLSCLMSLRGMALSPPPRIMLCTSESAMDKIERALNAGADEYIVKPFDHEILRHKLMLLGLESEA